MTVMPVSVDGVHLKGDPPSMAQMTRVTRGNVEWGKAAKQASPHQTLPKSPTNTRERALPVSGFVGYTSPLGSSTATLPAVAQQLRRKQIYYIIYQTYNV